MHVASNTRTQKVSPVMHLSGYYPSFRYRGFAAAWNKTRDPHDDRWCVQRIDLNATAAAIHHFGRIDVTKKNSGPWFANKLVK